MLSGLLMNCKHTWITGYQDSGRLSLLRATKKVLIPGDPEREMQELRIREGIPVVEVVLDDLQKSSPKNLISCCDLSLIYF